MMASEGFSVSTAAAKPKPRLGYILFLVTADDDGAVAGLSLK